jgi:hypothetical protein
MMKDGAGRAIWRKLGLFLYGFVYAPGLVQEAEVRASESIPAKAVFSLVRPTTASEASSG